MLLQVQVHSDHHEIVADLIQTSFLFSIPVDGPMSFSTRYVSVQWALRFEFLTSPKNVDWARYVPGLVPRFQNDEVGLKMIVPP